MRREEKILGIFSHDKRTDNLSLSPYFLRGVWNQSISWFDVFPLVAWLLRKLLSPAALTFTTQMLLKPSEIELDSRFGDSEISAKNPQKREPPIPARHLFSTWVSLRPSWYLYKDNDRIWGKKAVSVFTYCYTQSLSVPFISFLIFYEKLDFGQANCC